MERHHLAKANDAGPGRKAPSGVSRDGGASPLMQLHQRHGNQGLQRLLCDRRLQAKLTLSRP
jgi:hypothetical protein